MTIHCIGEMSPITSWTRKGTCRVVLGASEAIRLQTYLKEKDAWGTARSTNVYWPDIPSAKLYLVGSKIVNLNLNYEPQTAIPNIVARYLTRLTGSRFSVSVARRFGLNEVRLACSL